MPVLSEALWETLRCSVCLETCKKPYRLPCEHFFCREPCLQGLLNSERPTCPNCRKVFSRADVVPFRTLNDIMNLIEKPPQTNQPGEGAICPICFRLVQAPLKRSEHFSEMVCGDCWNTGVVIRESIWDEPTPRESSSGFRHSGQVAVENNQEGRVATCPFCRQQTPLYMTEYYSEPVCNDCRMSAELAQQLAINDTQAETSPQTVEPSRGIHRSRDVALQDNQHAKAERCPVCSRWVETPLQMSEHFSELVCADCWSTGEVIREFVVEEPTQRDYSGGIHPSEEVALQDKKQTREVWCPVCSRWVETPPQSTEDALQNNQPDNKVICPHCHGLIPIQNGSGIFVFGFK